MRLASSVHNKNKTQTPTGRHSTGSESSPWRSELWWRMPLVGTILSSPLIASASLFLAVYGSGTYADFRTLFLGSLAVTTASVLVGALLVAVPFDLGVIQRRTLKARQIALARCLAYATLGGIDGYVIYHVVKNWLLNAPPPAALFPALLAWFPLSGILIGIAYTLYEQLVEQMQRSARLEQELVVARTIQQDLFPKQFPELPGLSFAAHCTPARETGGDFYDVIYLGDNRVGVVVADVAGKSIAAALLMANARSIWRAAAATGAPPKYVLEQTNRALCRDISSLAFVTLFYAILDTAQPAVYFAGAGHPPPILCQRRALHELNANGLPLGLVPGAEYEEAWTPLQPGDRLILYTDGVVESLNVKREMFGFDRLNNTLSRLAVNPLEQQPTDPPQTTINGILSAIQQFSGPVEQADDVTILVVHMGASV